MTMNDGKSGAMSSEINVTPMIDLLLVLLIIFMLIVPVMPRGESVRLPQPAREDGSRSDAIILELLKGSDGSVGFRINQYEVSPADLPGRLAALYANRSERVLFLKGDDRLAFNQVAEVIDVAHSAGVDRIGLVTPKIEAGD
jgi:biopolymer transport protein TolR